MNIYNLNNNINDNICLDYEPFLIEAQCKSFCNDTNENDILSLLKPYFGKENYTTFDKYISNCMIIPGQNKAIIQINDRSFGNFIFENYQVLNKDFPLIYKGMSIYIYNIYCLYLSLCIYIHFNPSDIAFINE